MSIRTEIIHTSHPFLSVTVDPATEDRSHLRLLPEDGDALVICYDEAFAILGDLEYFARLVVAAVVPAGSLGFDLDDAEHIEAAHGLSISYTTTGADGAVHHATDFTADPKAFAAVLRLFADDVA